MDTTADLTCLIEALQGKAGSPLAAGILAARALDLASDSRSFARQFGVAHALVLRECVALEQELGLLQLDDRGDRSLRQFFDLTQAGQALIDGLAA